jgi:hypothetical protein
MYQPRQGTAEEEADMTRALILIATLACALVAAGSVGAAIHVSGNYTVTDFGTSDCRPAGAALWLVRCEISGFTSVYTGSLTGTSTVTFVQLIDCLRGETVGQGTETFVGSMAGVGSGTLTWQTSFRASFDCATFEPSNFVGRGSMIDGTGALASVRGPLVFGIDTYEGTLR